MFLSENFFEIPVLVLKNIIIFPKSIIPVLVGKPVSVNAIEKANNNEKKLIFITNENNDDKNDLNKKGTLCQIVRFIKMSNGNFKVLLEGINRAESKKILITEESINCEISLIKTSTVLNEIDLEANWRSFANVYKEYSKYNSKLPENIIDKYSSIETMELIIDAIAPHLSIKAIDKKKY